MNARYAARCIRRNAAGGTLLWSVLLACLLVLPATANADSELQLESGGSTAWLNFESQTDAQGRLEYRRFTQDLKPPVGFRHRYISIEGPFLPGDESTGPEGFFSFADFGLVEPAEQTPEVAIVYRKADDHGHLQTHLMMQSFYRNPETGLQCFGSQDSGPYSGSISWIVTPEGQRTALVAGDPGFAKAFGGSPESSPALPQKITASPQNVDAVDMTAPEIRAAPGVDGLISAHADALWSAYVATPAADLIEKRARFAGWFADQTALGRIQEARAALTRERDPLKLATAAGYEDALDIVALQWPTFRSMNSSDGMTIRIGKAFERGALRRAPAVADDGHAAAVLRLTGLTLQRGTKVGRATVWRTTRQLRGNLRVRFRLSTAARVTVRLASAHGTPRSNVKSVRLKSGSATVSLRGLLRGLPDGSVRLSVTIKNSTGTVTRALSARR